MIFITYSTAHHVYINNIYNFNQTFNTILLKPSATPPPHVWTTDDCWFVN